MPFMGVGGGPDPQDEPISTQHHGLSRGSTCSVIFIDLDSDRCRPLLYFTHDTRTVRSLIIRIGLFCVCPSPPPARRHHQLQPWNL